MKKKIVLLTIVLFLGVLSFMSYAWPVIGGSSGTWANELNRDLNKSLGENGTLVPNLNVSFGVINVTNITSGDWRGSAIIDAFLGTLNASKLFNFPALNDFITIHWVNITDRATHLGNFTYNLVNLTDNQVSDDIAANSSRLVNIPALNDLITIHWINITDRATHLGNFTYNLVNLTDSQVADNIASNYSLLTNKPAAIDENAADDLPNTGGNATGDYSFGGGTVNMTAAKVQGDFNITGTNYMYFFNASIYMRWNGTCLITQSLTVRDEQC